MTQLKHTRLPDKKEAKKIHEKEAKRNIPTSKINTNFFKYDYIIDLAKYFNIDYSFFTNTYTQEDMKNKEVLQNAEVFINDFKNILINRQITKQDKEILDRVYDYLSEEDELQKSDLIFVFGAKTSLLRMQKAIEVYKNKYANKIMISGKGPNYEKDITLTEAEEYANIALENNIPEQDLILEKQAITMVDNAKRSLNLLEEQNISHKSIILINSPFSQRRGYAAFQKYSDNIQLIRVNCDIVDKYDLKNN